MGKRKNIAKQAYAHPILLEVFDLLNLKIIYSGYYPYTKVKTIPIDLAKLRKATWLVSILAGSKKEKHRIRAQRFATLLYLSNTDEAEYLDVIKVCYVLFSRLGNLTATRFFKQLFDVKDTETMRYDYDTLLSMELLLQRQSKTIKTVNGTVLLTSFQKGLWNGLNDESNLAVSAPTSSGKSFILKQFLTQTYTVETRFKTIYVVPSRALINQVSEEFRIELINTNTLIRTAYIEGDEEEPGTENIREVVREPKILYILTPERCIKLLTADLAQKIDIDFIFIDEIQGVEDEQGRGSTFENVFEDLAVQFPKAKLVTAGPHISKPEKTFLEVFGKEATPFRTQLSPVIQFKKIVRATQQKDLEIEVRDDINKPLVINIDTDYNAQSLFKNGSNGNIIERVINLVAPAQSNIVFSNRGDYAEKWAQEYQESKDYLKVPKRVQELIDFLKDEFNPKYYLIDCLEKGVAFHHGKLPDIIRKEVEELFQDKKILNLFCTSTLIEGVNLPANNLFIITPRKNLEDLTDFEFGNLIGRAGRLSESLYGSIYFIEKPNHKGKTPQEYFDAEYDKEIQTFSTKNLPEYNFKYLKGNINEIEILNENGKRDKNEIAKQKNLTLFIRNKFIKNRDSVEAFLLKKNIGDEQVARSLAVLDTELAEISIPRRIILENQSIDPLLQNELYLAVKNSEIHNWVITPNKLLEKRRRKDDALALPNKERPFFWQLLTIIEGLDNIFDLRTETFERYSISGVGTIGMAIHATTWLQGKSYKELINDDIKYYSSDNPRVTDDKRIDPTSKKDVNKLIGKVIKINSSIVTYLLVKYIKLLVDVLDEVLTDEEKEIYKITLGLPTALELGTRDKNVKNLISSGISRTVAISVTKLYKRKTSEGYREENTILKWLSNQTEIKELKPIYVRYLRRLRLIKQKGN